MRPLGRWLRRLFLTLRPHRLDENLDDELQFHIDQRTDELIAQGIAPGEARRQATRRFGNQTLQKERARERDILVWLESAIQDIRYALRMLRRNPGFAATAILSLALGIGANTALFSIVDALLLRRLPVKEPASLVRLQIKYPQFPEFSTVSYAFFDLVGKNAHMISGATAMSFGGRSIEESGQTIPTNVEIVSGGYFDVLGVGASRGRVFHDAKEPIAVISDALWRSHYAPGEAIGRRIKVGKITYTIVGVADVRFRGDQVDWAADVWIPLEQAVPAGDPRRGQDWASFEMIERLAPGASIAQSQAETQALLSANLAGQSRHFDHPQQRDEFLDQRVRLEPASTGISNLRTRYFRPLLVVMCVAAMVLLIACANLANLMLARATAREREIATRKAIGAGRARLIRQLLTESALITLLGATASVFLARWLSAALLRFFPDAVHALPNLAFRVDFRMLSFVIAICVATCLLAGLAPAIRASGPPRAQASTGGRALIAIEVALCTILLIGSGWFVRTLWNLRTLDAGFARDRILLATVGAWSAERTEATARFEDLRERLAALPGVRSVGYSNMELMIGDEIVGAIEAEGHQPARTENLGATELRISPGFFSTFETPLVDGRDFKDSDEAGAPQVAIVNETFARHFFDGGNAIGGHFGQYGTKSAHDYEIVGVVKDTKYASLREAPRPIFYRPFRQTRLDQGMVIAIRSSGDLGTLAGAVREIVHQTDPQIKKIDRFSTIIDASLASERMVAQLSAAFGALALLVACIGVYGILAYRVARRTREIGVRLALGASRAGVQWMIVRESLALLVIGVAIGIPLALGLSRYVASLLYGLRPTDPMTIAAALGVLAIVSMAAAIIPARRAARIDPMGALRCE